MTFLKKTTLALLSSFLLFSGPVLADDVSDLKKIVEEQKARIDRQDQLIRELYERVQKFEGTTQKYETSKTPAYTQAPPKSVDLSEREAPPSVLTNSYGNLSSLSSSQEWFRRIDLSGFGAAGYAITGQDAERENGGFLSYQATLFIDARVWENVNFFTEVEVVRLGSETRQDLGTREIYARFKNIFADENDGGMGIKIGRLDIPYGEGKLWEDAVDNPLITNDVPWPSGVDEGIELYGQWRGVGWQLAVMDGSNTRGLDDDSDKMIVGRIQGKPTEFLYLAASASRTGDTTASSQVFGGNILEPVGTGGRFSTLGTSTSGIIDPLAYELAATFFHQDKAQLGVFGGQVFIEDQDGTFNRDLTYFAIEPLYRINDQLYLVARYSGIGTFSESEGYHFEGGPYSDGVASFGDDVSQLTRFSIGLGYRPNPNTLLKLEYGFDDYVLIRQSPLNDHAEDRQFFGSQAVLSF